jgi:hypothetical protein
MTWEDFQEPPEDAPTCPVCESAPGIFIGDLGRLDWFRCVGCGIDFNIKVDDRG